MMWCNASLALTSRNKGAIMLKFKNPIRIVGPMPAFAASAAQAATSPTLIRALFMLCHGAGRWRWALALGALAVFSATFSATASAQNIADNAQFVRIDPAGQPTPINGNCARFVIVRRANLGGAAFTDTQKARLGELAVSFNMRMQDTGLTGGVVTFPAGADRIEFMATTTTNGGALVGIVNAQPTPSNCPTSSRMTTAGLASPSARGWRIQLRCAGNAAPVTVGSVARQCGSGYTMVRSQSGRGYLNFAAAGHAGMSNYAANPASNLAPVTTNGGPRDQSIAPGTDASTLTGMAGFFQDGNAPGMTVAGNPNGGVPYIRETLRFYLHDGNNVVVAGADMVPGLSIDRFTGEFSGTISQHTPEGTTHKIGILVRDYNYPNPAAVTDLFTLTVTSIPPDTTPRVELADPAYTITATNVKINFRRVAGMHGSVSNTNDATILVSTHATASTYFAVADSKTVTIAAGSDTGSATFTRTTTNEPASSNSLPPSLETFSVSHFWHHDRVHRPWRQCATVYILPPQYPHARFLALLWRKPWGCPRNY